MVKKNIYTLIILTIVVSLLLTPLNSSSVYAEIESDIALIDNDDGGSLDDTADSTIPETPSDSNDNNSGGGDIVSPPPSDNPTTDTGSNNTTPVSPLPPSSSNATSGSTSSGVANNVTSGAVNNQVPLTPGTVDTRLSSLIIQCGTLVPTFSPDVYEYTVYVTKEQENKNCGTQVTAFNESLNIKAEGPTVFVDKDVTKKVIIESPSGEKSVYSIRVHILKDTELYINNSLYTVSDDPDVEALPLGFNKKKQEIDGEKVYAAKNKDEGIVLIQFVNSTNEKDRLWYLYDEEKSTLSLATIKQIGEISFVAINNPTDLLYGEGPDGLAYYSYEEDGTLTFYANKIKKISIVSEGSKLLLVIFIITMLSIMLATYIYKRKCKNDKIAAENYYKVKFSLEDCADLMRLDAPKIAIENNAVGKIVLKWDEIEGADRYEVYSSKDKEGPFELLAGTSFRELIHYSALSGETYYYKVKALNKNYPEFTSEFSDVVDGTDKLQLLPPAVSVTNDISGKIVLRWEEAEGTDKYEVFKASRESGPYNLFVTTSFRELIHYSAVSGEECYYKVRCINKYNPAIRSDFSESVKGVDKTQLKAPNVSVDNDISGKIIVRWDETEGADKYEVYKSSREEGPYTLFIATVYRELIHYSVSRGETHYYKIRAINVKYPEISSNYSDIVKGVDKTKLSIPIVSVDNDSKGKIVLKWENVPDADKYEVCVSQNIDGPYRVLRTTVYRELIHYSALAGQTYYYKVKAINSDNPQMNSDYCKCIKGIDKVNRNN